MTISKAAMIGAMMLAACGLEVEREPVSNHMSAEAAKELVDIISNTRGQTCDQISDKIIMQALRYVDDPERVAQSGEKTVQLLDGTTTAELIIRSVGDGVKEVGAKFSQEVEETGSFAGEITTTCTDE